MTIKAFSIKKINGLQNGYDREVKAMIITLALFAAAMIMGAGTLKHTSDYIGEYTDIFNNYLLLRSDCKIYEIFIRTFLLNFFFLSVVIFTGLSCTGIPIAVLMVLLRGFGIGFFAGFLFSRFSISGIGYYLITVLPGAIIANTALLLACHNAVFLSADILAVTLSKKQPEENTIKIFLKKNAIILLICIASSIIDSLLFKAFEYMFVFN